jgi:NAD(P)-dependent dehydrogenase (short-subunit alcohol dehydrogenase family)
VKLPVAYNYLPILNAPIGKAIYYCPMAAATALQRLGNPDEIAKTVLFLASDAASLLPEKILADGGYSNYALR